MPICLGAQCLGAHEKNTKKHEKTPKNMKKPQKPENLKKHVFMKKNRVAHRHKSYCLIFMKNTKKQLKNTIFTTF